MQVEQYPQITATRAIYLQNYAKTKNMSKQGFDQKLKRFQFGWKFIIFLTLNFYLFSGPLAFAFPEYYDFNRSTLLPLNIVLILVLILDIVYDFFLLPKMVQNQSELIVFKSFRKNARKYAKLSKYYLIDHAQLWDILILALLCVHYVPNYEIGRYFGLIIVLKLSNMVTYNNEMYKRLHAKPMARSVYTMAKIIYLMALLTHYLGIIFYVIDQTLIDNEYFGSIASNPAYYYQGMSLCFSPIQTGSLFQKYVWAAYYSSSLISTIAYGDIVAKNYFQNIYVCFLMIISTLFIALLLEQFMILVREQKFDQYQFTKNFNCLKEFMNQKLVPIQIQNSVRSYLVYLQFQKKLKNQKPVMDSLTKKLQRQILSFGYLNIYESSFRFLGINSKQMLMQVGLLLQEVLCQADCVMLNPFLNNKQIEDEENIQNHEIQFHSPSLYFVYEGKVQQFTRYQQTSKEFNFLIDQPSKTINKRALNMYQFITGTQLRYGIRTLQLTKLIKFNPQQFLSFIMTNEQVYHNFKATKQKVLCQEISVQHIDGNCFICEQNDHTFAHCPKCHYSLKQNIKDTIKLTDLLASQKYFNLRYLKNRQNMRSKKVKDISHPSAVWGKLQMKNLSFAYDLLFNKTTKQLLNLHHIDSKEVHQDSKYDNFGIDPLFQI